MCGSGMDTRPENIYIFIFLNKDILHQLAKSK